ncbi:MAG TPA: DUF6665 family protein [Devosia sp.]|nr:DUF6665 family protein [Devosia sp.]
MAFDLPDRSALNRRSDAAFNVLEADMAAEKASSLGRHGRLVEEAIAALAAFDATPGGNKDERMKLVRKAAREVWAFLVQRELCGLRDQKQIIRDYAIPGEVLVRLGAIER